MGLVSYIFGKNSIKREDVVKLLLLGLAFFLVIGGYTLAKELKDSIFVSIVGREYLPFVKIVSMFVLIPLVLLYSRLVDVLRRYQLLSFYSVLYGAATLICVYFLGNPVIGLANTDASPNRIFGWVFYFIIEGYSPFVVSVLWAFTNSVTNPDEVRWSYPLLTAASKIGGSVAAGGAWLLFSLAGAEGCWSLISDTHIHQIILAVSAVALLAIPLVLKFFIKLVPGRFLKGYEAAYKDAKAKALKEKKDKKFRGPLAWIKGVWSGISMLIERPYVLGIFGMLFFWELINVVFQYMRLGIGQASTHSIGGLSAFLYKQIFFVHIFGLVFALVGTNFVLKVLGERKGLMLIPLSIGTLMLYYLWAQTAAAVSVVYIGMRIINYVLAYPLREALYIPTTKEIKFKTKSWIDSFGSKLSKSVGSYYNIVSSAFAGVALMQLHIVFFALVIACWTVLTHFLGKRFEKAIENNEVIGADATR